MGLKCGIIGITNVGKTVIFNCISRTRAETSSFAFSTNKSNIGMIDVPDDRLQKIDALIRSARIVPATVEIVDIPGLAKGSSQGEGIGNKFLADIQQTDAIIHVLRCFDDPDLPHIEGSVDPVRDMEIVDLELQVRDLDLVQRKIQRVEKMAKSGDKELKRQAGILQQLADHLENFRNVRDFHLDEPDRSQLLGDMFLLTDKPVMYVCNVDDHSAVQGNHYSDSVKKAMEGRNIPVLIIAGRLESEIAELDNPAERLEFLQDAGLSEPGVNKMIRLAYDMLNLQSFFTAGPKEVRAWTVRKGATAPQAAGVIHSDLERGFIRAEVMKYEDFIQYGSEHAVKESGKFHVEGKNYIVQDGDILNIRFNV
ncbi:MAG: redox-regulated ATPase YchF [Sphingobacteriia bacterium]|nr:redox-regulated ATPase YchF [Sphingobacteriia bacterium]HRW97390.1 redox-regulated ATPase YchF [Bacteroidales bacterium]